MINIILRNKGRTLLNAHILVTIKSVAVKIEQNAIFNTPKDDCLVITCHKDYIKFS